MPNFDPSPATRFRPGASGNPAGRPRSKPITDRLRARLETAGADGKTVADDLVDAWLAAALKGDVAALREILNRLEGKVADRADHGGEMMVRVVYDEPGLAADRPSGGPDDGAAAPGASC